MLARRLSAKPFRNHFRDCHHRAGHVSVLSYGNGQERGFLHQICLSIEVVGSSQFPGIALYGNGNWDDCTLGTQCSRIGYASGGVAPYSWSAAGLPPGVSIRSGSGNTSSYVAPGNFELWGSPTALGSYNVQLTVNDSNGASATGIYPLNVSSLFLSYASDSLNGGAIGAGYSRTLRVISGSSDSLIVSVRRVAGCRTGYR